MDPKIRKHFLFVFLTAVWASPASLPAASVTLSMASIPNLSSIGDFYVNQNYFIPSRHGPVSILVNCPVFPGAYSLRIYNTTGEFIRDLSQDNHDPSSLSGPVSEWYHWDGTNFNGNPCVSGVYLIYLEEPLSRKVKKIVLIH